MISKIPVLKDEGFGGGYSAKMMTLNTSDLAMIMPTLAPAVTTGSVFTGKFVLDIFNQLKSTQFGVAYNG